MNGNLQGNGNPREFGIDVGYSRRLSDRLGLGVGLKYIYSNLAQGATSTSGVYKAGNAVAADLGLYYSGLSEAGQGLAFGAALPTWVPRLRIPTMRNKKILSRPTWALALRIPPCWTKAIKIMFGIDVNKLLVPTPPTFEPNPNNEDSR
jgi:hypothetical protein